MDDNVFSGNIPVSGVSDADIICELREAVKAYRTKRPWKVADMIDAALSKEFSVIEEQRYSNAIFRMREYIGNITNQCSLKYTKRYLIVSEILNELDGG